MKLTTVILLTVFLQSIAGTSYSQNTTLSISLKNASVQKVMQQIEDQSDFYFLYSRTVVDVDRTVDIQLKNAKIIEVLSALFNGTDVDYKVEGRQIVLSKNLDASATENQQQKTVSGKVTDSSGASLPGVTVVVKGTTNGTITDGNGDYRINNVPGSSTMQFSFVGMKSQEIVVGEKSTINVTLVEETIGLEEVVAIGYGTVKKSDLTGSVAALKSEDLNPGANSSVDQMMQGRTAGVQITQSSSEPGGGLSIRIRGASSINAGNDPLYVIDGFPIDNSSNLAANSLSTDPNNVSIGQALGSSLTPKNPLNSLNPNDIESIEILKDASATAIYGSRGANGVVLITTKKGKGDKLTVSFDTYMGIQTVAKTIDVMNAGQYMNFINDVSTDRGTGEVFSEADKAAVGRGIYWQNEVFKTAPISDYTFSVTGGVGKSRIYASLDYFNQDGVLKNTGQQKYIGRLNMDTQISDRTNIGFNINTSLILDDNGIDGVNTNESAGPIYASLLYDPTEQVYNEDGTFAVSPNLTINNPMSLVEGVSSKSETNRTMVNFFINFKIIEGLTAKLNLGSDRSNVKRDVYVSTLTNRGLALGGYADATSMGRSSYLAEYTMSYNKEINENNRFDIVGGITYQKFNFNVFNAQVSGFPSDEIGTNNLSLGDLTSDYITSNKEDNSLQSYLGRINYALYNKILLTGSIRADGSSRFGANNKYGYFPSFALGYKLSEEDFIPDFFEELKLRASWGQTGNQEIANYASLLTFGTGRFVNLDGSVQGSLMPLRIANPDLKWETTSQFNVGVDARVLKGKINLTMDYFSKNTTDLLFNLPVPQSSGYSSVLTNVGEVNNKGFEFLLNTTNISGRDFKWSSSINLTSIRNNVVDLGRVDQLTTGYLQAVGGNSAAIKVGSPLASYWGYEIVGIQQEGDPNPGYPKMKDQLTVDTNGDGIPDTGDGVITSADATIIGNPYPDFTYGISNEFKYKNWLLSFFIQGQQGGDLFNVMAAESMYPTNDRRNRMTMMMDRWTADNTSAKWPSATNPSAYPGGSSAKVNSLTVMDATYLRLKNAQISYNVPVDKIGFLSSLKVYVTGQNLFTITNYPGYDPEANSFGRNNVKVDYASYPLARTFMFGLNATF